MKGLPVPLWIVTVLISLILCLSSIDITEAVTACDPGPVNTPLGCGNKHSSICYIGACLWDCGPLQCYFWSGCESHEMSYEFWWDAGGGNIMWEQTCVCEEDCGSECDWDGTCVSKYGEGYYCDVGSCSSPNSCTCKSSCTPSSECDAHSDCPGSECDFSTCTCTVEYCDTCDDMGKTCGSWVNNCGNSLNCGTCTAIDTDGGYNLNQRGTCSWRNCNSGICQTTATQTDSCIGSASVYEMQPSGSNCIGGTVSCPPSYPTCNNGACIGGCSPSDCEKCSTQSGWTMTFCPGNCASGSCTNDPCTCVAGECGAHCTGPAAGLWCTSGSTCYYGTCGINSCTIPSGGSCTVTGCVSVPPTTYDVYFYQSGITDGSNWCVAVSGLGTRCKGALPGGLWSGISGSHTYSFSVYGSWNPSGSSCTGTITGTTSRTCSFTPSVTCTDECSSCSNCPGSDSDCTVYGSCGGFTTTCDETGTRSITSYTCNVGGDGCRDCSSSSSSSSCTRSTNGNLCGTTDCDYLDGCSGTTWRDYNDCQSTCSGGNCPPCSCSSYSSIPNDPRCGDCSSDSDCPSDGWYCDAGNVREYRDYYCSGGNCLHSDSSSSDCDNSDGCVGTTYRDYYCSSGSCTYSSSYNDPICTECSTNNDCGIKDCDYLDGCSGTTYRDYSDCQRICSGGSCQDCTCSYSSSSNDPRCGGGCVPATCGSLGKNCGSWWDGCSQNINCGSCGSGETCTNGVCQCVPTTCSALGKNCGSWSDNCGGTLNCGSCGSGETCTNGVCQCVPTTCSALGKNCGSWSDNCGGTLNCGSCGSGYKCQNGVCTYCNSCESCSDCQGGSDCRSNVGSCGSFSSTCDETGTRTFTQWSCYDGDGDGCKDCVSSGDSESCSRVTDGWYCSLCELCNTNGACSVLMPDDPNCGTIDCSGWYVQTGTEGVTGTEYCYNKYDITSNRCEAADSNSCKDDNTADCSPQGNDAVQYSCGICKYISSSSCTGTTLGSCTNYPSDTVCDQADCDYMDRCVGDNWYEYDDCTFYCNSGNCPNCICGDDGATTGCDCNLQTPDCSLTSYEGTNNWDGDSLPCNCDCGGYDQEEEEANGDTCEDEIDNDCDGRMDSDDFDCPLNTMNFAGYLKYLTGEPVSKSLVRVTIKNETLGYEKSGFSESKESGYFTVTVHNIKSKMMNAGGFDLSIFVAGEVEAIYECRYNKQSGLCS